MTKYEEFKKDVIKYISKYSKQKEITEKEEFGIIKLLFDDGRYTIKDVAEHVLSVRTFNSNYGIE